jgi:hypothetical protein
VAQQRGQYEVDSVYYYQDCADLPGLEEELVVVAFSASECARGTMLKLIIAVLLADYILVLVRVADKISLVAQLGKLETVG